MKYTIRTALVIRTDGMKETTKVLAQISDSGEVLGIVGETRPVEDLYSQVKAIAGRKF